MFQGIGSQFDRAFNRKAYLHNYLNLPLFNGDASEFVASRQSLSDIIQEYQKAEGEEYAHSMENSSVCFPQIEEG